MYQSSPGMHGIMQGVDRKEPSLGLSVRRKNKHSTLHIGLSTVLAWFLASGYNFTCTFIM